MLTRRTILTGAPALASVWASMQADASDEMLCDRLERLSNELSMNLDEWLHGQFKAVVYPNSHRYGGVIFKSISHYG